MKKLCSNFNETKKSESKTFNHSVLGKNQPPKEKDKIKVLTCAYEKNGVKKGDQGELFLVDKDKVFAIFFDEKGFCRAGETLKFDEFLITEPYDDYDDLLALLM